MTKRELDNASASSLAQALEVEALAQSVNVHTDDLREALDRLHASAGPPNVHGPVARCADDERRAPTTGTKSSTTSSSGAPRRARWAARSGWRSTARAGKLDARARIDHLLDPGSFQELGTLVGGDDAPADAIVMGSGRIDGRPVMVAAEDFTVKAGTISQAGELEALPRRRDRGRRPRAAGHDARRRRASAPTGSAHAPHAHRHARPGALLGPRAARHRGARRVGRTRRAGRADVRLHGDEQPRVDLHGRPAGGARVAGRDDHQGRARRPGGRARERPDPQRRRPTTPPRSTSCARYLSYFPSSAWSYPPDDAGGDTGPRLVPEMLDIVPRNGRRVYDMRKVIDVVFDAGSLLRGATRVRPVR